jgi:hypothetical protein
MTKILLATDTDFRPLASIVMNFQKQDPYYKLLFDRSLPNNAQDELDHTELNIWISIKSDNCRTWKAVIEKTSFFHKRQEPIGLSSIIFVQDAQQSLAWSTSSEEVSSYQHCPETLNSKLFDFTQRELSRLQKKCKSDQRYVYWNCFMVLPQHRGENIESEMILWGFKHFGLANHIVVVETTSSKVFLSYVWTLMDILNIDLRVWNSEVENIDNDYVSMC